MLADFGNIARWAPNAEHSCLLSEQTEGVGTVRRVQAGRFVLVERVTVWQPELMLAYTIDGMPPPIRQATNTWIVRPHDVGASVTVLTEIDAGSGPARRFVAVVAARRLGGAATKMLDGLAAHLAASDKEHHRG